MNSTDTKTGWVALIPDTRAWVIVGIFLLAYKLLSMIEANPTLLSNAAFMIVVSLIIGGAGLGAVVSFLFGGTKTGSDVMKAQSDAVINSSPPSTNSVTVSTTDPQT